MESQLTKRGSGRELAIVLHGPHCCPEDMQGVSMAVFSYVGHWSGTYLLGHALLR